MGLFDDLLAPLRDLAGVKDEVMNEVTNVTDSLKEVADPVTQPLEDLGVIEGSNEEPKQ